MEIGADSFVWALTGSDNAVCLQYIVGVFGPSMIGFHLQFTGED